jgi:hypothetical protein
MGAGFFNLEDFDEESDFCSFLQAGHRVDGSGLSTRLFVPMNRGQHHGFVE